MAPPSPRRSSRARATNSQSQQSSVSSGTSGRHERSTRSHIKPPSGKSTPSASLSSEPLDDLDDTLLSRRRKRGQEDDPDRAPRADNTIMANNGSDDLQDEEDEAVRCICGSEDYPGRPPVEGPDADFFAGIELTEEVTGFFVQCDICKVWQHGACVGIFSAEASPDEYFCEQCRKDLHRIHTASNGGSKRERLSSASQAAAKRRSTMNSRDAAYDDELLRRVIEASKEDVVHDTSDTASRRAKRGRSDSEELVSHTSQPIDDGLTSHRNGTVAKRQRTGSRSVSPPAEQHPDANGADASDEDSSTRNGAKKSRNNRIPREKLEKEDKEQLRQEAASKRKGRAERRRAEDSDLSEEMPLAAVKVHVVPSKSVEPPSVEETPTPAQPPGTPPTSNPATLNTHKRAARSSHKRGKGRNQYTKDRDPDDESPARSMSRDIQKSADEPIHGKASGDSKHGHKGKQATAHKMSMLDMKRRVAAIMEFISRTQVDLAGEHGGSTSSSGADTPQKNEATGAPGDAAKPDGVGTNGATPDAPDANGFKELNCMEMMDVLTRDMVKWQNQYS
ncbi:PHD-finger domain-containing protein [Purpureocillium lavendulum]|uniref:PHD-finger domain-containing protein n=1 Tax=Purpureocillium lavendulum TaxID=1247861 RepID=A0AB34FXV6_9HYPO|nr:PHD-finger domain-containing protein [Purpureocillium lavendulum]